MLSLKNPLEPADWSEKQDIILAITVHDSNILANASSFNDVVSDELNVISASNFDNADSDFMPAVQYGFNDVPAFYINFINFTAVDFHNNTSYCSKSMVEPITLILMK
ncbi:hypothetical protein V8G54_023293 [Vigna mungo]|uniref:Uncharacterized protein n=1 Tax=Vigna mungo TaxID=3915 RepID=A0AAQ3N448_VIGMU